LFDSVIIGFDGSAQADDALALGRLIASLGEGGIVLAYITEHQPPFERQRRKYAQARREKVHEVLEPALSEFPDHRRVEPASIDASSPARGLHDLASEYGLYGSCALVIGSTHRGPVGRVLLGATGELLISGAPCPITVAPRGFAKQAPQSIANVVAGFDGSLESRMALRAAHGVARAANAALRAVSIAHPSVYRRRDPDGAIPRDRAELEASLREAVAELDGDVDCAICDGDPVEELERAAEDADLLALGARGYGPLHHVFVGSVSAKLIRSSPSPILLLPRPEPGGDGEPAEDVRTGKQSA
jgi:nucleotide-binding universal stress UspA family protein